MLLLSILKRSLTRMAFGLAPCCARIVLFPWKRIMRAASWTFAILLIMSAAGGLWLWHLHFFDVPDLKGIMESRQEMSRMFDDEGNVIGEYCNYCRTVTSIGDMGKFPKIAVALEDNKFWTRWLPVSPKGILRAMWRDSKTGHLEQGASTITQQTARNLFLEEELEAEHAKRPHAKLWRKMRELWIAYELEKHFPKEKILEAYLNSSYCGRGQYGIAACSAYYFDKDPGKLDAGQAALIVALFRSPESSSPILHPREARELRARALDQLVHGEIITQEAAALFNAAPLPKENAERGRAQLTSHFREYVRRETLKRNLQVVDGSLDIHTSIHLAWQKVASDTLRASIEAMEKRNGYDDLMGAAVLVDAHTGSIKAWAEYPAFKDNQFLTDQIERQTGSTFKPFFYATWIAKGGRLDCKDEGAGPCMLDDSYAYGDAKSAIYVPMGGGRGAKYLMNFPYAGLPRYRGRIPAIVALYESRNVATMSGMMGVHGSRADSFPDKTRISKDEVLETAEKLGIAPPKVDPGLTISIGSIEASPLNMAGALTGLLGEKASMHPVERITDSTGATVFEPQLKSERVLDELVSLQIVRGMRAVAEEPTGTAASAYRELGFEIMGKTGTATNTEGIATDNWFIGCTPSYCMAVWIGRRTKLPLEREGGRPETGGRNALPVFTATMKEIYRDRPKEEFPPQTDPMKPFTYPNPPDAK